MEIEHINGVVDQNNKLIKEDLHMDGRIKNFLESEDDLKDGYGAGQKLIMLLFCLLLPALEMIFYFCDIHFIGRYATKADFVSAVVYVGVLAVVFVVFLFLNRYKFFYLYYGIIGLIACLESIYISFRIAFFAFPIVSYVVPHIAWIVLSVFCVIAILDNIKKGLYQPRTKRGLTEEERSKIHIVVGKYTLIEFAVFVLMVVAEMALTIYSGRNILVMENADYIAYQCAFSVLIFFIGMVALQGWKLVVKGVYALKYWNELAVELEDDTEMADGERG